MKKSEISKTIKAGKIASKTKEYARDIIKPGMPLLEIAEKIENKIKELGGDPAFPTNLSINEIAAHYTPTPNDDTVASGLLKVDFGVHIDGWIADTAFSLDMEKNFENKKLIQVAEDCLKNAEKIMKKGISTNEIGKEIYRTCISNNVNSIVNLNGHEIDKYDLHAGITIPNINNKKDEKITNGIYAVEPFVTRGDGKIYEGKPSEIYLLLNTKNIRNPTAREILTYITDQYGNLPFCSRWVINEFGTKSIRALKLLKQQGNIHQYPQLVEKSKNKVAQAENTILIQDKEVTITTKDSKKEE